MTRRRRPSSLPVMTAKLYHEPTTQFLARMIIATREGQQITSEDAARLDDHATYGTHVPTTMPEARADASRLLNEPSRRELVTD
jgi:hypothetical protein